MSMIAIDRQLPELHGAARHFRDFGEVGFKGLKDVFHHLNQPQR
jgi:hypothetical protein